MLNLFDIYEAHSNPSIFTWFRVRPDRQRGFWSQCYYSLRIIYPTSRESWKRAIWTKTFFFKIYFKSTNIFITKLVEQKLIKFFIIIAEHGILSKIYIFKNREILVREYAYYLKLQLSYRTLCCDFH